MPEVVVYQDSVTVYYSELNILLNTAPNLTGIDQDIQVTQASNAITVTQ